jgi:ABC-type glycerol-3-phosphate transport system permease component
VLGAPPARGINWFLYVIPALVVLVVLAPVAILVFIVSESLKREKRPASQPSLQQSPMETNQDEYIRKIEDQLQARTGLPAASRGVERAEKVKR